MYVVCLCLSLCLWDYGLFIDKSWILQEWITVEEPLLRETPQGVQNLLVPTNEKNWIGQLSKPWTAERKPPARTLVSRIASHFALTDRWVRKTHDVARHGEKLQHCNSTMSQMICEALRAVKRCKCEALHAMISGAPRFITPCIPPIGWFHWSRGFYLQCIYTRSECLRIVCIFHIYYDIFNWK